jgi:Ca-activated chloride channel homolog
VVLYRDFGVTELVFVSAFGLFYLFYVVRMIRIARQLNTPFSSIFFKLILRTAMFGLLILSLLGPSFGDAKKEVKSVGKDIMICVDLSKSMDAFDIQPTRLEKVKFELKKIVSAFNSDRIGLIIFSSEAFMQCPLTYDQNALNLFIETMSTSLVPPSGTDFGPPLRMAIKKIESDDDSNVTQTKSKVLILISDGEDFGENTGEVASEIERQGIKLFTLGIGTEKGGKIYASNGYKKDRNGNVVVSKLNTRSLRSLANKTGGQYFEVNDTRNDVSRLINTIDKIEGEFRDARFVDVTSNRYFYFLGLAILLLLIDTLTTVHTIKI